MFSQTVEYALRAVVHLAMYPDQALTAEDIAKQTKVPRAYLAKVLQALHRAGVVRSQRGVRGGTRLARPPEELSILDVVNAVDPIKRINYCPLGLKQHGERLCPLHHRMDQALASVETALAKSTLAEVLSEPTESIPLHEVAPPRREPPPVDARPQ
ncbi:MAG TPA: Rrf2 family transcriptional regulator [Planctomycetia bacterium]|nr:Rrf2 family transcriptional regulator [Planctomycetia bacterium]